MTFYFSLATSLEKCFLCRLVYIFLVFLKKLWLHSFVMLFAVKSGLNPVKSKKNTAYAALVFEAGAPFAGNHSSGDHRSFAGTRLAGDIESRTSG